jgi:hypothetical protein
MTRARSSTRRTEQLTGRPNNSLLAPANAIMSSLEAIVSLTDILTPRSDSAPVNSKLSPLWEREGVMILHARARTVLRRPGYPVAVERKGPVKRKPNVLALGERELEALLEQILLPKEVAS